MTTRLYVGNLDYAVDDAKLYEVFSTCGTVRSARVMLDRETGQSKGFAFVEMESAEEAQRSIELIHGKDVEGRPISVSEAKPKSESGSSPSELSPWLRKMLDRTSNSGFHTGRDGYVSGHRQKRSKDRGARSR